MPELDFRTATAEQIAAVDPGEFVRVIKSLGDKDVKALFESDNRSAVLAAIFTRMPELFRPDRAGTVRAVTHWSITGGADGAADEWTVTIADGTCTSEPGHVGDSTLALAMAPGDFVKVITKSGNPVMMFMMGKIKARGDLGLAANVSNFFELPKA